MIRLPRVVVAGTRSGVGKTSVAVGLMAALSARGRTTSGHKVGPDFIDPSYHALATGRPARNLDPVLVGAARVAPLLAHGASGADLAVIEGVMGLFDGRGSGDHGSSAHVARLLDAPVVLVVDAASASRSVAAEVHGFATFEPQLRLAGIVLNRVGSERHEQLLRAALAPLHIPLLGALRRDDRLTIPSRHLGLVPAGERGSAARASVAALAEGVARSVDLAALEGIARAAPPLHAAAWTPLDATDGPQAGPGAPPVVAVASGPAFTFSYHEHGELLAAAGARLAGFDPTRDEQLPAGTAALYLGGGFPEEHADDLAANLPARRQVTALAAAGAPIVAECGGLLYLCHRLVGRSMCGVIDAEATWDARLTLGYREATTASPSPLGPARRRLVTHEFHRTTVTPRAGRRAAWELAGHPPEGFAGPSLHASYLHPHWVAAPDVAAALVAAARRFAAFRGGREQAARPDPGAGRLAAGRAGGRATP